MSSQAILNPLEVNFEYQSTDLIYQSGAASSEIGVQQLTFQLLKSSEEAALELSAGIGGPQLVVDPRSFYQ